MKIKRSEATDSQGWLFEAAPRSQRSLQRVAACFVTLLHKLLILAAFVLFISYVQSVTAGEAIEMEQVGQGTLFYRGAHDGQYRTAPVLSTEVDMRVTGFVNRAHIVQTFTNDSSDWVEGVYVFPLPENAAVDHMQMRIGERVIKGKIKERAEAKKIYQQARAQGKRSSLLEQERPNMFTTSVANIGPGEQIKIEIEFQQTLRYDQGQFHLRFPLAITPRYIPGSKVASSPGHVNASALPTDQVADADRITPIVALGKKVNPVSLHIELDAGFPLETLTSPYHATEHKAHGPGQYTITLSSGSVPADRDFELKWKPELGFAPKAALFREQVGNENYYLLMMLPPSQERKTHVLPREVIYVIDTSGSMGGVSIRQARKALLLGLKRLRSTDYFNVIQFNSVSDKLFNKASPATAANIARATNYVAGLNAGGGTEMMQAMHEALQKHEDTPRLRQVIFLTDGAIGNEDALFEYIRHHLGKDRLFTVGIGSAPNSHFMRKAAQFGKGTFTFIGDVNEVQQKMQQLFAKLDTPVMRDLKLTQHFGDFETWPQVMPDLYAGEPLMLTARSRAQSGEVQLFGKGRSNNWQASLFLQQGKAGTGIGKLWARSKIDALLDSLHDGADKQQVRNDVVKLALVHHLVSRYTSLVAVDLTPVRPQHEALKSKAVPTNLPYGQDAKKIFGMQAQTGTAQYLLFVLGSLLLLAAVLLVLLRQRREAPCAV
jgi:Ca-activated chloride channel family protein